MKLAEIVRAWLRKYRPVFRPAKATNLRLLVEELERRETPSTTNLALSGAAYRWYGLGSANSNANRVAAAALNDNNLANSVILTGAGDDATNAYEAGGVIWSGSQSVGAIKFISGSFNSSTYDGVFDNNFALQTTTDGKTWSKVSGWTVSPAYQYNLAAAAGVTYTFTGPTLSVRGVRVVGQVHSRSGSDSWYATATEVQAFGAGTSTSSPAATFSNGGSVDVGSSATVSFTGASGGSGGYKYSYDFNNDGTFEISNTAATQATVPSSYLSTVGAHVVHGRITDSAGAFTDYTTSVTVNALPTATFNNGGPVVQGNSGTVSFTGATGGSGGYSYSYDFNNDGTWEINNSAAATATVPASYLSTAGSHVIRGGISDSKGGSSIYTTTITVTSASSSPTATFSNGGSVVQGNGGSVSFTGSTGGSGGYTYSYDFNNDGAFEIANSASASATVPASYLNTVGGHVIHGRIADSSGGFTDYTTTITVTAATTGHTYYVASTGNDSNNGSAGSPWRTLQVGVSHLLPGDVLNVESGSYAGFIIGWDPAGQGVYGVIAGTAGNQITIQADPAAAPGSVIINARNAKTYTGIDLEPGCDYVTVAGFAIQGAGGIATYPNKGYGIKVTGNYDQVLNNTISNLDYAVAGIHDDGGNNAVIKGNTITGIHAHANANYGHGIYVADADGVAVQGNTIHDNDYIGIHLNGDPNLVSHALIEGNLIYNNGQNGINADGLQSSVIQNNVIYGYQGFGICLYQIDASGPSKNNIIVNNTIVSTVSGAGAAIRILNAGTGNTILNNILLGASGVVLRIAADSMSGLVSNYNIGGGVYQSEDTGATQTLAQWRTQTGQDANTQTATAAQLFVNASGNDYRLSSSSPAINAGTSTDAPSKDFLGNPRPAGGAFDIGAYEFT